MADESIYPEYSPTESFTLIADEKKEIINALVLGWDDGGISGWNIMHNRVSYALRYAKNITIDRKKEIAKYLYQIESIDSDLFQQKRLIIHHVDSIMTTYPQPKTVQELISKLDVYDIPVVKFLTKYGQFRCQSEIATWADFVASYPVPQPTEEP